LSKIENGRLRPDNTLLSRLQKVLLSCKPEISHHFLKQSSIQEWLAAALS
jgi:hypothetical protein